MQAAFTHKLAVLYNACLQEIGALQKKKSEMVEYLQSKFREEEIANKVEFASFLKKRSEPIEAGSPEHFKASYWIIRYSRKTLSMQAAFTYKLAELYNACSQEIGTLQSFPKWRPCNLKKVAKSLESTLSKNFKGALTAEEL